MKRVLLFLCAVSLAVSLAACADKTEENDKVIPDGVDDEIQNPEDADAADTKVDEDSADTKVDEDSANTKADEKPVDTKADEKPVDTKADENSVNVQKDGQSYDPLGAHFAGTWVNDSGQSAEIQIAGDGTKSFEIIARIYETPTEFSQYEIVADHAISTDGASGLLVTEYQRYDMMDVGGGIFDISIIPEKIEDMLLVYEKSSSNGMEYVTWFYSENDGDIITFIRSQDEGSYFLPVEKLRN